MKQPPAPAQRLTSLDILRGMTVAAMILVNCPGSDAVYPILAHAPWDGCTLADLVFPSFLVIMGVSLTLSLGRRVGYGERRGAIIAQAMKRAATIFGLGMLASLVMIKNLGFFRLPGVLQRIAVCYLGASVLFLETGPSAQALICAALLIGYWLLMRYVPVPGHGAGDLSSHGNLAAYVDRLILGRTMAENNDPEGIVSTLPALATTLIGVLAGRWLLRRERSPGWRALNFIAAGALGVAAGLFWARWFPLNKNLWSSSFALYTGGLTLCGLGLCHWIVEGLGWQAWGLPFEIFGRNALVAYFASEMFYGLQEFVSLPLRGGQSGNLKLWIVERFFDWLSSPAASLAYALLYLLFCLTLMAILYRKRIFIRV